MMPFEVLCTKSRIGRKLEPIPDEYKVLAFDPGETTGMCLFTRYNLTTSGQVETPDIGVAMDHFVHTIGQIKPDAIVVEDYKVYATHLKQHEWSELLTPKLVGILEGISASSKIPVEKQMAGRIKAFVTDDKLTAWRFYRPGLKHARDAIRHACFFLAFVQLPGFPDPKAKGR